MRWRKARWDSALRISCVGVLYKEEEEEEEVVVVEEEEEEKAVFVRDSVTNEHVMASGIALDCALTLGACSCG